MMKIKTLREKFNASAIKTKGLTLLIEHAPCCILSFAAGFIGLPLLNHNPVVELGFAFGGAVTGEYIGHKYFVKNHTHKSDWKSTARRYGLSLVFGLASWGIHQAVFHDHNHDETHTHKIEQHHSMQPECHDHEHDHKETLFFGSPALKKQIDDIHKRAHPNCAH